MGWIYVNERVWDTQAWLDKELAGLGLTILESALVRELRPVYYAAVQAADKRPVFAVVLLVESYLNRFGFKALSEATGPYYWDCPVSILDRLGEPSTPYAAQWRERCRKRATATI